MPKKDNNERYTLSVVPLRRMIIAPKVVTPILVGRERTLDAVQKAIAVNEPVICIQQKKELQENEYPKAADLYRIGTLTNIKQEFGLPDGNMRILCEGIHKVKVIRFFNSGSQLKAEVEFQYYDIDNIREELLEALLRNLKNVFTKYVEKAPKLPSEVGNSLELLEDPEEILNYCLNYVAINPRVKQGIFGLDQFEAAVKSLSIAIMQELNVINIAGKLEENIKESINKNQKEYFLNEQLKQIHKELGLVDDEESNLAFLKERIESTHLSDAAKEKLLTDLKRLMRINPQSAEYSVYLNYITWVLDLPWDEKEIGDISIDDSAYILDRDHYGLKDVKERILEYIAVMQINKNIKGQIMCFAGPPGVGKTSLGKSIAESLGREFVRISLGGVQDESEIRGHRRTYVGAMPGVIMQSMKNASSTNPLIMMDEIDKLSNDFRGDPAAALLEVLDPAQNSHFRDHYIDIEYDLSKVVFITTANDVSKIPLPLLDRMELIELPGYTEYEKVNIASKHLVPRQLDFHGVKDLIDIKFPEKVLHYIVKFYTREAGVRELDRTIGKLIRKIIKDHLKGEIKKSITLTDKHIQKYLGVEKYHHSGVNKEDTIGVVNGLAWTSVGGETLVIEVVKLPGEGKIQLTGKLGDVMKESAQAAISFARLHAEDYGIEADFHKKYDIHLHIPEGAVPKDGPSAGVTMTTAIVSLLSNRPVKANLAMTGEITLSGRVLPIGGLSEKLIAAKREGITNVLVPEQNRKDVSEINDEIKNGMNITFVSKLTEVLDIALVK